MSTEKLITELISALNACDWEEADRITEQIRETGNKNLIEEAEYLRDRI